MVLGVSSVVAVVAVPEVHTVLSPVLVPVFVPVTVPPPVAKVPSDNAVLNSASVPDIPTIEV